MRSVDARGLACPMPLVKAKVRIETLEPGEDLLVLATDPEAPIDIGAWAADNGHRCEVRQRGEWIEITVTKAGRAAGTSV